MEGLQSSISINVLTTCTLVLFLVKILYRTGLFWLFPWFLNDNTPYEHLLWTLITHMISFNYSSS